MNIASCYFLITENFKGFHPLFELNEITNKSNEITNYLYGSTFYNLLFKNWLIHL